MKDLDDYIDKLFSEEEIQEIINAMKGSRGTTSNGNGIAPAPGSTTSGTPPSPFGSGNPGVIPSPPISSNPGGGDVWTKVERGSQVTWTNHGSPGVQKKQEDKDWCKKCNRRAEFVRMSLICPQCKVHLGGC